MNFLHDLNEVFAGLTWPLRGRRVTSEIRHELSRNLEHSRELSRNITEFQLERVRAEGFLRSEIAALTNQLGRLRAQCDPVGEAQEQFKQLQDGLSQYRRDFLRYRYERGLLESGWPWRDVIEIGKVYRRHLLESLSHFPTRAAVNLHKMAPDQKPPVWLYLPRGELPDAYAESFETRLRLLGLPVQQIDQTTSPAGGIAVDIGSRLGRTPNRFPDVIEIQQAMAWLGLDHFLHIRSDSIRKTAAQFDKLITTIASFEDETSKRTAAAIILDQLTGLPLELFSVAMPYSTQYFGTGLIDFSADELVLDAGAANGDSLVKFLQEQPNFAAWYAFEPDPGLASSLSDVLQKYGGGKAVAMTQPLSEHSGQVQLCGELGSLNMYTVPGGGPMEALSIDDFLKGRPVSIIKMDVEGSEPELLRGAKNTIQAHRPRLMISAYHEVEHLYEIPEIIRSINPDYRMSLRNHSWAHRGDSWPGSFFCESVLYAY